MENNYKVVKSGERYIVVSYDGEVLDDAQGYGFKTPQAAYKCMAYKSKSMKELTDNKLRKHIAKKWFDKHKELKEDIVDYFYQYCRMYGEEPTNKMVAEIFQDSLTPAPMKAEWMVRYINN